MADPQQVEIIREGAEKWNRWRTDNESVGVDLSGADLRGVDLRGADLRGANLCRADLMQVNLRGANLSGADLRGPQLSWADLSGADLSAAFLTRADLMQVNLRGANLSGAELNETVLGNSDFTNARGLDLCKHSGPSTLDHRTIAKSGRLPLSFLRGCGLPDTLIDLPSLLNQPIQFYSCFISYSHEDKAFAGRLHDTLQGRGIRCWLDDKQLRAGDDILDHVDRGIRLWDKVLLCCSKNSLTSGWVEAEIDKALEKEQMLRKQRQEKVLALIPLDLDGYLFNGWESGRASVVRQRLAADFHGWNESHARCEEQIDKVILALRADEHAREKPPKSLL